MHNYKELEVWKKSVLLAELIYQKTKSFPDHKKFGMISQMRRCSVSVASNISEGAGRNGKKEFRQFLGYAIASSFELETQLIIAQNIDYLGEQQFCELNGKLNQIQKMLVGLNKSLN